MFLKNEKADFKNRIVKVKENDKAKFGKMNVNQMVCHCADQFRMLFGEIKGLKRENVNLREMRAKIQRNETVKTVDGLDQVSGEGTKPKDFEEDKKILISYIDKFSQCANDYKFSFHPYMGEITGDQWESLVIHHLKHHLSQFGR